MFDHLSGYLLMMLLLLAFIVWRRARRTFGRQPIKRRSMIGRIAILAVIGGLLALRTLHHLALAEGLFGGVLVGGLIALVGLRLTRFEVDPIKGDCYVPNPWIGALLMVLLLGRLGWRSLRVWSQLPHGSTQDVSIQMQSSGYPSSALTMLLIGLLMGYYIVYFSGVLVHHRRFVRASLTNTTVQQEQA